MELQTVWLLLLAESSIISMFFKSSNSEKSTHNIYLSFNSGLISSKTSAGFSAAQQKLERCQIVDDAIIDFAYPEIVNNHMDFWNLSRKFNESNVCGVIGDRNYFISILNLPDTILGQCRLRSKSFFVETVDQDFLSFLNVGISYLNAMRKQQNFPNDVVTALEKTLLIAPKYIIERSNPFQNLDIEIALKLIGTPVNVFWNATEDDYMKVVDLISEQNPTNVIILLYGDRLNDLLLESYKRNQFVWRRRWIMLPSYGKLPNLPMQLSVVSQNITVIHLGDKNEAVDEKKWSGIDKLAYDAAFLGYNYLSSVCCRIHNKNLIKLHSGAFDLSDVNFPRIYTTYLVYRKLGFSQEMVGYIEAGTKVQIIAPDVPNFEDSMEEIVDIMHSRPIRIAAALATPFVMLRENFGPPPTTDAVINANDLTGFSIDIIKELLVDFEYEIKLYCGDNISSSGAGALAKILYSVKSGNSDIAIGDFAVIPEMLKDFDFLTDYQYFSFSVLTKPIDTSTQEWIFLIFEPLSCGLWVAELFSAIIVAILLATLNYVSQNRMEYGFVESVFVVFGTLFQGHAISPPNRFSSRVLFCFWFLYALFVLIIYAANYSAIQMNKPLKSDFDGFHSLLADTTIPFGTIENSMAHKQLKSSNQEVIMRVNLLSESLFKLKISSLEEAVSMVTRGEFRLIGDSFTLQYYANKFCLSVSDEIKSQRYAMLLQKHSVYIPFLKDILQVIRANKTIESLRNKYLTERTCKAEQNYKSNTTGVTFLAVGGIFIFLAIGILTFIIFTVMEIVFWRKLNISADQSSSESGSQRVRNFF